MKYTQYFIFVDFSFPPGLTCLCEELLKKRSLPANVLVDIVRKKWGKFNLFSKLGLSGGEFVS